METRSSEYGGIPSVDGHQTTMNILSRTLRKQLERTIADARDVPPSRGRGRRFEALAVHDCEPYRHMNGSQRILRRRLRAHARQLGDRRDPRSAETQAIDRLVRECAYEHWHGMLFARFLAENRLLMEPELEDRRCAGGMRGTGEGTGEPISGRLRPASPSGCCRKCSGPITRSSRCGSRVNTS